MKTLELFVQGEGSNDITMVEVLPTMTLEEVVKVAQGDGICSPATEGRLAVFVEDEDCSIDLEKSVQEAGIANRKHIHIHRCRKITARVNFNGDVRQRVFSPSATIRQVKKWATGPQGFTMSEIDASEHALEICGTTTRLDDDTHIGTSAAFPECAVCFNLVPKQRVEG